MPIRRDHRPPQRQSLRSKYKVVIGGGRRRRSGQQIGADSIATMRSAPKQMANLSENEVPAPASRSGFTQAAPGGASGRCKDHYKVGFLPALAYGQEAGHSADLPGHKEEKTMSTAYRLWESRNGPILDRNVTRRILAKVFTPKLAEVIKKYGIKLRSKTVVPARR